MENIKINPADKISIDIFVKNIGKQAYKTSKNNCQPKPFKSGLKTNTIKGVIEHPILKIPAYTFFEDESYVECRRCIISFSTSQFRFLTLLTRPLSQIYHFLFLRQLRISRPR